MRHEVLEAMLPWFTSAYGNPSSFHQLGAQARRAVDHARAMVAEALGARTEREIIFTGSGTEANHTAIRSALKSVPKRRRIVTTAVEHSSVRNLCRKLEEEGYELIRIGVSKTGVLDWAAFEEALTSETALVSVMWANNETGVLFPAERIARTVKERGLLIHVDAVQMAGKISIDLSKTPVDFLSISGHKFHGPKGTGALFVRESTPFEPLFFGGGQELDRRAGTENVPGIVGLGRALKLACETIEPDGLRIAELRDRLERELVRRIPESFVNGARALRLPNTSNITIPGIPAEAFLIRMSDIGVMASSGSACSTGALEPSHVLEAMGHSRELAMSSIRFSLSRRTTADEIDRVLDIVPALVSKLRDLDQVGHV